MLERLTIFIINIFLPPLSVMIIAGVGTDCLINTLLFICGVIPAHIHAFYLSCTYYSRKRKVRKGRYPGGRKAGIYSQRVVSGGADEERVRELWKEKLAVENGKKRRMSGRVGGGEKVRMGSSVGSVGVEERTWDGRRESRRSCMRPVSQSTSSRY